LPDLPNFVSNSELIGETLPPGNGGTGSRRNDEPMGDGAPDSPVKACNATVLGVLGVGGAVIEAPSSPSDTNARFGPLDSGSSSETGARLLFLLGRTLAFDLR
jgi:hypothetical protein